MRFCAGLLPNGQGHQPRVEQDVLPWSDHGGRPAGDGVLLLKRFAGALPQRRLRGRVHGPPRRGRCGPASPARSAPPG